MAQRRITRDKKKGGKSGRRTERSGVRSARGSVLSPAPLEPPRVNPRFGKRVAMLLIKWSVHFLSVHDRQGKRLPDKLSSLTESTAPISSPPRSGGPSPRFRRGRTRSVPATGFPEGCACGAGLAGRGGRVAAVRRARMSAREGDAQGSAGPSRRGGGRHDVTRASCAPPTPWRPGPGLHASCEAGIRQCFAWARPCRPVGCRGDNLRPAGHVLSGGTCRETTGGRLVHDESITASVQGLI